MCRPLFALCVPDVCPMCDPFGREDETPAYNRKSARCQCLTPRAPQAPRSVSHMREDHSQARSPLRSGLTHGESVPSGPPRSRTRRPPDRCAVAGLRRQLRHRLRRRHRVTRPEGTNSCPACRRDAPGTADTQRRCEGRPRSRFRRERPRAQVAGGRRRLQPARRRRTSRPRFPDCCPPSITKRQ